MRINKQAFQLSGVTENDYMKWCEENNKKYYLPKTKREFFDKILNKKLIKDYNGKLIKNTKKI